MRSRPYRYDGLLAHYSTQVYQVNSFQLEIVHAK